MVANQTAIMEAGETALLLRRNLIISLSTGAQQDGMVFGADLQSLKVLRTKYASFSIFWTYQLKGKQQIEYLLSYLRYYNDRFLLCFSAESRGIQ